MPPPHATDLLLALAQIAVSLAGFSGLIAALRTATSDWHPRDIWSLSWMLGTSIGALMLALLPVWLVLAGVEEGAAFRAASGVACVYLGLLLTAMSIAGRRLTRRGYPPRVPYFPPMLFLLLGLAAAVDAWAVADVSTQLRVAAYVGSLILLLLAALLALCVFLVLLARTTRRD